MTYLDVVQVAGEFLYTLQDRWITRSWNLGILCKRCVRQVPLAFSYRSWG
jgi:hypothetical protein